MSWFCCRRRYRPYYILDGVFDELLEALFFFSCDVLVPVNLFRTAKLVYTNSKCFVPRTVCARLKETVELLPKIVHNSECLDSTPLKLQNPSYTNSK